MGFRSDYFKFKEENLQFRRAARLSKGIWASTLKAPEAVGEVVPGKITSDLEVSLSHRGEQLMLMKNATLSA